MPPNIQNVSFSNPAYMVAPDLVVQQQQVARQQALADELRRQSLEDIQVAPGSRVSWTQGAAKLADALISRSQYKKADQQNSGMAQQYAQALKGMFGGQQGAPAQPPQAPQQPAPQAPPPDPYARGSYGSGGIDDPGNLTPPNQPPPTPVAATPSAPAPSPGGDAGGASSRGPWSLSGNPGQDMSDYMLNPEKYGEAVIAAHAPVDTARVVQQAQEAMQRGDIATAHALLGKINKDNYITPIEQRQGSIERDPTTNRIIGYNAASPTPGAVPTFDANGNVTQWTLPNGTTQVIAATEGARTAAAASNKSVTGYDAQGHPVFTNELNASHGGGGVAPALPPGSNEFLGGLGKHGSDYFADLQTKAQPINNQIYALRQMVNLANGPTVYGPGSDAAVKTAGILNQFGQALGVPGSFNDTNVTSQQEMSKWAGQVAANAATAMGLNGSDARFQIALESNPSGHLTNKAIGQIGTQVIGLTQAIGGQAQAGARFASQHPGAQAQGQFQSLWNQNYDPRIYTWLAQGPAVVKQNMAALKQSSPAQFNALVAKAKWLGDNGALPQ